MPRLTPARDVTPAEWIVADRQRFGASVLSLLPKGFPAYVRVFHPAQRLVNDEETPVRWAAVAAATGTRANPGMQLYALTHGLKYQHDPLPGVYDWGPAEGSIPEDVAAVLAAVLARHTATPEQCWFAVCDGFGATRADIHTAPDLSSAGAYLPPPRGSSVGCDRERS